MRLWLDLQTYVTNRKKSASAETPTSSLNSDHAVRIHRKLIRTDRMMAPMGSIHHLSFDPPTLVRRPTPLMKRSLRWSSQRMRIWLYLLRRAQQ